KSVAHVPLALYLLLAGADGALAEPELRALVSYEALVAAALPTIDRRFPEAARRDRQVRIVRRSLAFIAQVVRDKRIAAGALREFVRAQREDIVENFKDAAREQVSTMHRQVTAWASLLSAEERVRLRVVIGTSHMARRGNLALQYFAAWLHE